MPEVPTGRSLKKKAMPERRARKSTRQFDPAKIKRAVALLLDGIGEDPSRPGLKDTPRRVSELYEEILSGMWTEPEEFIVPLRTRQDHDLVVVRDIGFASICEHHLLPFMGKVAVAYQPRGRRIVGISKIVRAVDVVSSRLQIQERMTVQIADAIARRLKPAGVLVRVEAEHLCMTMRGVKKPGSLIVTTEARGTFRQPARQTLVLASLTG
jgi:GTP cyclohydrolase I